MEWKDNRLTPPPIKEQECETYLVLWREKDSTNNWQDRIGEKHNLFYAIDTYYGKDEERESFWELGFVDVINHEKEEMNRKYKGEMKLVDKSKVEIVYYTELPSLPKGE